MSFADFLLGLVEILATNCPHEPEWQQLHTLLREVEDDVRIVDTLVPAIRQANQQRQRTLVIMVENMGEVFTKQIKDKREIAALRKFLMESKNGCLLIGTATQSFSGLTSVDEPFYDFFDVQHLDHLSEDEATQLVRRTLEWEKRADLLAQWEELHPRILALYRMTGGSPRLTVMLAELIAKDSVIEVKEQFRILMDRITPFFQDRLKAISGSQECAVLETMATMRDQDKTPASIAKRMRMKASQVSTLLGRLTDQRLVRSSQHAQDKRVRRYTISEGLFDLWLYMNVSRGARERQPFLLDFFATFYPSYLSREKKRVELLEDAGKQEKRANALAALDTLSEIGTPFERARSKVVLATAYSRGGHPTDAQSVLREASHEPLDRVGGWIVRSAIENDYPDYLTEIEDLITLWDEHRSGNLEAFVRKMREMGDGFTPFAYSKVKLAFLEAHLEEVPPGEDRVRLRLKVGRIHRELAHWPESETQRRLAVEEAEAYAPALLSWTLNDYAQLLQATNRLKEAESLMRRALDLDEKINGPDHPSVAIRLNNLALLLQDTSRLAEAESLMRRALVVDEKSLGPNHPNIARDLNNLAQLLHDMGVLEEAEPLMRRAIELTEKTFGSSHHNVAIALNNLAQLLHDRGKLQDAEPLMRRALELDEKKFGADHPNVARDLNNLAQLLEVTNRHMEAEQLMLRTLEIDQRSFGPDHPIVARDLNNLALLMGSTNRLAEAEPLMRRANAIFRSFLMETGHPHPQFASFSESYRLLLEAVGKTPQQIEQELAALS
ncbi:MAG: tetratricopeptide repeat protein [Verrucomicrobiaceae bacterium]|nr:tetratricopeptide repeat protein [Verrucomicrobiaceae bacterium]